jgi:hypothetical protein
MSMKRRGAMKPTPTPLVILARLLAERRGEELPAFGEREAEEVQGALRRLAWTRREREVAEYLIRAATGGDTPGTGAGSLKHLLWWLRDHAGELYELLARALLERVLENPSLPLHEGLASRLLHDALLSAWVPKALEGARREDLVACLEWEKIGGFLVAFNPTEANLTKPAMEAGAHLYVAASEAGSALKARKEKGQPQAVPPEALDAICERAGGKWAAPYPDLRVCREGAPTLEALKAAAREVLSAQAERRPKQTERR